MVLDDDRSPYGHSNEDEDDGDDEEQSDYPEEDEDDSDRYNSEDMDYPDEDEFDNEEEVMDSAEKEEDEEEDEGEDRDKEEGRGDDNELFKIYRILHGAYALGRRPQIWESKTAEKVASINIEQLSGYDSFTEAVHKEWMKLLNRPRADIIDEENPWPLFNCVYYTRYGDRVDSKVWSWEDFKRSVTSAEMEEDAILLYYKFPKPKSQQERNLFRRDGVYRDGQGPLDRIARLYLSKLDISINNALARVVHEIYIWHEIYRCNSFNTKDPIPVVERNAEVIGIEESWPGCTVRLVGRDGRTLNYYNMDWLSLTLALCHIEVESDVEEAEEEEEEDANDERAIVDGGVRDFGIYKHIKENAYEMGRNLGFRGESYIVSINIEELSGYDSFAEALHREWMKLLSRPRAEIVDKDNPWPFFRCIYKTTHGDHADSEVLSWEDFKRSATLAIMEEEGILVYYKFPIRTSQEQLDNFERYGVYLDGKGPFRRIAKLYLSELEDDEHYALAAVMNKIYVSYNRKDPINDNVLIGIEECWPGCTVHLVARDGSTLQYDIDWLSLTLDLCRIEVESVVESDDESVSCGSMCIQGEPPEEPAADTHVFVSYGATEKFLPSMITT